MNSVVFAKDLTLSDAILLRNLADDISRYQKQSSCKDNESATELLEKEVGYVIGKLRDASPPASSFVTPQGE